MSNPFYFLNIFYMKSTPWSLWTDTTFDLTEYWTSTILGQYEIRAQQACYGAGSQMEEENVEDFEIVGCRNETGKILEAFVVVLTFDCIN